jgi:GntR family transcriptional regulator, transcriptional repressor for pyruvate dehydrogenase complex
MIHPAATFKPLKKRRSFEEISDEIKALIINGHLKAGDKLPSETEIARQFNVGRQTIRDAMRVLEQAGFIGVERGGTGGPYIRDTVLSNLASLFLDAFKLRKTSLDEFRAARMELERLVFVYAMRNMDHLDIDSLQENVTKAKEKLRRNLVAFEEHMEFHKILARASKNYLFVIVIEAVCTIHSDFFIKIAQEDVLSLSRRTARAHQAVAHALAAGKKDEALALFEKHLNEVATRYYKSIAEEVQHGGDISPRKMTAQKPQRPLRKERQGRVRLKYGT